jgi:hypothetical protein
MGPCDGTTMKNTITPIMMRMARAPMYLFLSAFQSAFALHNYMTMITAAIDTGTKMR